MMIYKTRQEATENTTEAVLQVDGGYITCTWQEAYARIAEEAKSLYAMGWCAYDMIPLMSAYLFDKEHATVICQELAELE